MNVAYATRVWSDHNGLFHWVESISGDERVVKAESISEITYSLRSKVYIIVLNMPLNSII